MLLTLTAPTSITSRSDHGLLDGLADRVGHALVALGTRMTSAVAPAPRAALDTARRAAGARRDADAHLRDNAAQLHPLGLR